MPRAKKTTKTGQPKAEKQTKEAPSHRELYRSSHNRVLAGVAGGLGDYFALDPLLIRIIFILLTFFANGIGILLYIVLWALLPEEGQIPQSPRDTIHENMKAFKEDFHKMRNDFNKNQTTSRHVWGGIILLILGLLFLSNGFGFSFHLFWPLILILLGIFLIYQQR